MKAWRQHPSTGKYRNHRAQRAHGAINRNARFGASKLLQALFKRMGLHHE